MAGGDAGGGFRRDESRPDARRGALGRSARLEAAPGPPVRPLRVVVGGPPSPALQILNEVEGAFARKHLLLFDRLGALEAVIADGPASPPARGALEQVAFVRVGLRCIADAIGELVANVEELDDQTPGRPGTTLEPA